MSDATPSPETETTPPADAHPAKKAPPSTLKRLAKTWGPWLVAGLVLVWVSRGVDWHAVLQAFQRVWLPGFVGFAVLMLVLNCAADTLAMYFTFGWFGCRLPYRELFIVRAATYLVAVIQYYVGQAALLGVLHQRRGVPLWRGAGWVLFISGINMAVLVLLASAGMVRADIPIPWLRWVPLVVGVGAVFYGVLLRLKPGFLARWQIMAPMFEVGVMGHIKGTLVRLPHVVVLLIWHFFSLRWFGVEVPPLVALVYLPAVFFFAALPVSVQGLGLSQWAAVFFFSAYAPGVTPEQKAAPVMAYSLAMTAVALLIQVSMGILALRPAQKLGLQEATDETA